MKYLMQQLTSWPLKWLPDMFEHRPSPCPGVKRMWACFNPNPNPSLLQAWCGAAGNRFTAPGTHVTLPASDVGFTTATEPRRTNNERAHNRRRKSDVRASVSYSNRPKTLNTELRYSRRAEPAGGGALLRRVVDDWLWWELKSRDVNQSHQRDAEALPVL